MTEVERKEYVSTIADKIIELRNAPGPRLKYKDFYKAFGGDMGMYDIAFKYITSNGVPKYTVIEHAKEADHEFDEQILEDMLAEHREKDPGFHAA